MWVPKWRNARAFRRPRADTELRRYADTAAVSVCGLFVGEHVFKPQFDAVPQAAEETGFFHGFEGDDGFFGQHFALVSDFQLAQHLAFFHGGDNGLDGFQHGFHFRAFAVRDGDVNGFGKAGVDGVFLSFVNLHGGDGFSAS